jgi:hypothetical protein
VNVAAVTVAAVTGVAVTAAAVSAGAAARQQRELNLTLESISYSLLTLRSLGMQW